MELPLLNVVTDEKPRQIAARVLKEHHSSAVFIENLLDLADLRTLPEGRALALVGNLPPVELAVPAWWERPDAGELTAGRDTFRKRLAEAA